MMARLMSFPANQFVLRQKGGRPDYVYADPAACTCAYVGSVAAMDKIPSQLWGIAGGRPVVREFYGPRTEYDQQHGERRRWGIVQ